MPDTLGNSDSDQITADILLQAYQQGLFPMARSEDEEEIYWVEPEYRGIIPLDNVHISKSLAKTIRKQKFEIRINHNFADIIKGCASLKAGRDETWINDTIKALYYQLFQAGHCHTVEVWQNNELKGGLYGVHINACFFGESMFSYATDASKVALVYLIARLKYGGFCLLDTQFITSHLQTFGAIEIPKHDYSQILSSALRRRGDFLRLSTDTSPSVVLQLVNQTSNTGCSTA